MQTKNREEVMEIKTKDALKENQELMNMTNFLSFLNYWTYNPQYFIKEIASNEKASRYLINDYLNLAKRSQQIINVVASLVERVTTIEQAILEEEAKIEDIRNNGYVNVPSKGLDKKDDIKIRQTKIANMQKVKSKLLNFEKVENERNYGESLRIVYRELNYGETSLRAAVVSYDVTKSLAFKFAKALNQEMSSRFNYPLSGYEDEVSANEGIKA